MARRVPGEPYTRITSDEAAEMLRDGDAAMIDVRRSDEFEKTHVTGALWIPVDDVLARFEELPKKARLLFICEVGVRSGLACEYAASLGVPWERLFNVEDGTPSWIEKGFPTSQGTTG